MADCRPSASSTERTDGWDLFREILGDTAEGDDERRVRCVALRAGRMGDGVGGLGTDLRGSLLSCVRPGAHGRSSVSRTSAIRWRCQPAHVVGWRSRRSSSAAARRSASERGAPPRSPSSCPVAMRSARSRVTCSNADRSGSGSTGRTPVAQRAATSSGHSGPPRRAGRSSSAASSWTEIPGGGEGRRARGALDAAYELAAAQAPAAAPAALRALAASPRRRRGLSRGRRPGRGASARPGCPGGREGGRLLAVSNMAIRPA